MNQANLPTVIPATPHEERSYDNQGQAFQRIRWRMFRNATTQWFGGSRIRLITMILSSLMVWAFVFAISWFGFHELVVRRIPGAGNIVGILFDLLFFALGGMLVFSTGLILYASLFSSVESRFLLCSAARADQIFASKYQSALIFASWAFVVLCSPILLSHGIVFQSPWYAYVALPFYFVGFVILPGAVGGILAILAVNYLPKKRSSLIALLITVGVLLLALWGARTLLSLRGISVNTTSGQRDALQTLVDQFALTQHWLMPSHWMAQGVLAMSRGELELGMYRLTLLWSNGLFAFLIAAWVAKRLYRRGYNRIATGGAANRKHGTIWMDRLLDATVSWLHPQIRKLILKDFRSFRRDPSQWGQLLLFAGLLGLYVLNSRRFYQNDFGRPFANWISLLNLSAMGLLLCAYLGRFIYPMLSLEGRKFWILGLLPLSRDRLLWGKFLFAFTGTVVFAVFLTAMSDLMLNVGFVAIGVHVLTVICLALGLSGLSVGLGACMPNFRETDPSKIVIGFGGTVNMIVSLGYLVLMVSVMALPYHLAEAARLASRGENGMLPVWGFLGLPLGVIGCALATWLPMHYGAKNLRKMEF
ncbi:putative ABC transporter permease subunit [Tuwongella immobilis]|uniref:Uncharacterized protein n=1 Tax=Tuwongella immobilis TaxID=692036 RepID=A0A6C2YHT7_9BACT|nr:hypothetical protein [Tuwongella immobilis]VIP01098.1 Uncharacterized protein OS=Singulisphaera acidiphila (strain ATCC BAA-1392 / DSM 18658 / VKM B-2454 / MOB10) GN=Sinac_6081 PE=4 SV=1 [Tuwongella immobilis]VTR97621.1 Uncharacterized protein OS=Singulisphaera acidiphila (strain ATCC BAA-1392 / DSM 18658 / VKM B-2454 / MOB10) GN=Sinac_6081 PE=4 SV=1 [Tuwongella immobilis]